MKQFGGRLLMTIGIILLALGGIVLGILQYTWINQIAESERERIQREINKNTIHVLAATTDEIQIILSLFQTARITGTGEDDPVRKIENNLIYWKKNSSYPGLIMEVYGISGSSAEQEETGRTYQFTDHGFESMEMPADIKEIRNLLYLHEDIGGREAALRKMREQGYVILGDRFRAGNMMFVCRIDFSILFNNIMAFYLEEYLPGYPYTIISRDGAVIARSEEDAQIHGKPELSVPLYNFLSMSRFPLGLFPPDVDEIPSERIDRPPPDFFYSRTNPLVRFWTERAFNQEEGPSADITGEPIATLHVYYPHQSLDSVITARKRANLILSFGILAILIISVLIIYRMYMHVRLVRAREQDFVASMSHELRTPITVIKSVSQNLMEGIISEKQKVVKYGSIIQDQSNRLSQMVEGILAYSGLSSGKRITKNEVDLHWFLREIIDSFSASADQAGAEIRYHGDGSIGTVRTDSSALRIIVENLLLNALRHGLPNEKHGYKKPYIINVNTARTEQGNLNGDVSITVEDHGGGVPQKEAQKIFEPFVRGKQAADSQRPGSGIGLHLVKRVAVLLGGSVELETPYVDRSGVSRTGCRFTVILPLTEEENGDG